MHFEKGYCTLISCVCGLMYGEVMYLYKAVHVTNNKYLLPYTNENKGNELGSCVMKCGDNINNMFSEKFVANHSSVKTW